MRRRASDTAPLMTRSRRRAVAFGLPASLVLLLVVVLVSAEVTGQPPKRHAVVGPTPQRAFARSVPAPVPAGWRQFRLPAGAGVLSVPPLLHEVGGDKGTVSAALLSQSGAYLAYLNATPLQGGERLEGWTQFRLEHLSDDDARSVHEESAVKMLHFRGGTGSCVMDDYVTDVGAHRFQELACLVEGGGTGSVVVAAAPSAEWGRLGPVLERAVAAYSIR